MSPSQGLRGALASFLLWITYTGQVTFQSTAISPSEVGAAIVVGLGGVVAVERWFHIERQARDLDAAANESASTAATLGQAMQESLAQHQGLSGERHTLPPDLKTVRS